MGIVLLVSELVSEIGVESSPNCQKHERNGQVLVSGTMGSFVSPFLISVFTELDRMKFAEGDLKNVQVGFPFPMEAETCFSCIPPENEIIIGKCTVDKWKTYKAGELRIGVRKGNDMLFTVTDHFAEVKDNGIVFDGFGDVVNTNDGRYSSILFKAYPDNDIVNYFEYEDSVQIELLKKSVLENRTDIAVGLTSTSVTMRNISCEESTVKTEVLAKISQTYRTSQLENPLTPLDFNETTREFNVSFTADSIYRAVYGTYLVSARGTEGSFTVYGRCGQYHWRYIVPMALSCLILVFLQIISCMRLRKVWRRKDVSNGFRNWYLHARQLQLETTTEDGSEPCSSSAARQMFDEVQFSYEEDTLSCANLTIHRRGAH